MTYPLETTTETTRIYDYVQSVISLVNDAATELLVDLPTKQYVTSGEAAFDCEQVAIAGVSLTTGLPASDSQGFGIPVGASCSPVWSINFDITIVRCGPKIQRNGTVLVEELNSSFLRMSQDVAVLTLAVEKLIADRASGNVVASITLAPPQGEMAATVMNVTAAIL